MKFNLENLENLTHENLDKAFGFIMMDASVRNDGHLKEKYSVLLRSHSSPYERLLQLLDLKMGKIGLGKFLGGKMQDLFNITDDSPIIVAARIFLKFKIMGDNYISENGRNDTCLHDALNCEPYTEALTRLLIQHGADPDQENDDHRTALAVYIRAYYKKHFSFQVMYVNYKDRFIQATQFMGSIHDLNLPNELPHKKLIQVIAHCIELCDSDLALFFLELADRYHQFDKHPGLLNFYYGIKIPTETMLHFVAKWHSPQVVEYILRHGANPDLLDRVNYKPIHSAVEKLMKNSNGNSDSLIENISRLLLASLYQALPLDQSLTATQIVDELLNLELMNPLFREEIINTIFQIQDENSYEFSHADLLSLLKRKSIFNLRNDVFLGKKLGEGSYGDVYFGIQDGLPVAIKFNIKFPGNYGMRLEAKFHENLSHPNVVNFICTLERKNAFGIVMEFANSGSLHNFIYSNDDNRMNHCFYSFSKQLHAGLKYLHNVVKVVHLDFKPDNILVDQSQENQIPRLMISDFGAVAKPGETRAYLITTVSYCPPELLSVDQPFDFLNDTFSFGVSLGEMLARRGPWSSLYSQTFFNGRKKQPLEVVIRDKVLAGEVANFGGAILPLDVSEFVKWTCQKNPKDRPNDTQIDEYIERKFKLF